MGALDSVEDLERIIAAANALVSREKGPSKPGRITEAAEAAAAICVQSSIREPVTNSNGSKRSPKYILALKGKIPYFFFLATFAVWLVSLLVIYLPISGWVTPSFPSAMNTTTMMIFLVATGLASISSLLIGLHKLGK